MKKTLLLIAAFSLFFSSCKKDEDPQPVNPPVVVPEITVSDPSQLFPVLSNAAGTAKVEFTTNSDWTASVINTRADGWVSVTPASGKSGKGEIIISAAENAGDERGATIQIKAGTATKSVTLTQKQKDAFTATASKLEFDKEGGSVEIKVTSNIDYTFAIDESCKDWISHAGTKATQTKTLAFAISKNEDIGKRSGHITVTSALGEEKFTVYQEGDTPSIVISQNEYTLNSDGGQFSVEVKSNVSVSVEMPSDCTWLTEVNTKAMSTNTYTFAVSVNETSDSRSAAIKFVNTENGLSEAVNVKQEGDAQETIPNDEIWYTTTTGSKISLSGTPFDQSIVSNTYSDGKGVIKLSGALGAINPSAMQEQTTLKEIKLPDSVESIGAEAFAACENLEYVTIPAGLESVGNYVFRACYKLKRFRGNPDFLTPDKKCFIYDVNFSYYSLNERGETVCISVKGPCIGASVQDIVDYEVPLGVVAIENYAFSYHSSLHSINLPISVRYIGGEAFSRSSNLEFIYGTYASGDNKSYIYEGQLMLVAQKGLKEYTTPAGCTSIAGNVFSRFQDLETVTINDEVQQIGMYAFSYCLKLKTITLPSQLLAFSYDPFRNSSALESIYLRSLTPPTLSTVYYTSFNNLTIYIPEQSESAYESSLQWEPYKKFFKTKSYPELTEGGWYVSKDFSRNGQVTALQNATEGNGIDIVIMGDAFSDRQIADGTYTTEMKNAMEAFFQVEPYKSFRNLFNVYQVDVVSNTEGYVHPGQALGTFFGEGTYIGGDNATILSYAKKALSDERMENATVIVEMNRDYYAGTCYMLQPETHATYGAGPAICLFPTFSNLESRAAILQHEAGGHGFGKLQDEYFYAGSSPDSQSKEQIENLQKYNWYANISFTDDLAKVPWARFVQDERYSESGLGAYEGCLYEYGAYRPSDYSIMRYNTGGFNAPSREAIYKRIHSLAHGSGWTYDYETFVKYDEVNRNAGGTKAAIKAASLSGESSRLHAPVVLDKTWREVIE